MNYKESNYGVSRSTTKIFLFIFLLSPFSIIQADNSMGTYPFIVVYANGQRPVENVLVSIVNPYKDKALLITSVEFEGQLPETRYFYHGIYSSIDKKGNNYEHFPMRQTLSRPVGTCFLLPEQSISWKRPMRVLTGGYKVEVAWQEIPEKDVSKTVWFQSQSKSETGIFIYEPLSEDKEIVYRSVSSVNNILPPTLLEGNYPVLTAKFEVNCRDEHGNSIKIRNAPKEFAGEGIEYSLDPISDSVIVTDKKVVFRKFNMELKKYETSPSPEISAVEVDFMFLCFHSQDKIIPCILDPNEFGDIIEVQKPYVNMYYNPGITRVPIDMFQKIFARAQERKIPIILRRIDPNSLGRQLVLTIGVEVDDNGRWKIK